MRKTFIILVLISIFFNEVGYFFYYSYQQYLVKKEVKEELLANIPSNLLEEISLDDNKDKINWKDDGEEFLLNGQMYDIQKTIIKNGKTFFYCLNDTKETALIKKISTAAHRNSNRSSSEKNKHVLKLQVNDYLVYTTETGIGLPVISQPFFVHFNEKPLAASQEIITPPPRA